MANIYDVAAAIKQPDIVGSITAGQQTAQANNIYAEKQQAYQQAQSDQQNIRSLAPQVIAGDPNATAQVAAIDPSQATALQGAGNQQLTRLSGAIQYLDQQTTPEAKEAAYQSAVKPYLAVLGASSGKVPPDSYAQAEPAMLAAKAQIAQLGQASGQSLINVGAGGAVFDPVTKKPVFQNTNEKPQLIQGADGSYAWATPGGPAVPVTYGGAPANAAQGNAATSTAPATPPTSFAAAMNQMISGGMTADQAMQRLERQYPTTQIAVETDPKTGQFKDATPAPGQTLASVSGDATGGGFGGQPSTTGAVPGAPVMAYHKPESVVSTLSPDDVKSLGLPAGTVAQRSADGKVSIVSKPDQNSTQIAAPGDATKTGDAYLATLPSSMQPLVKAIAAGNQAPPSASSRSPEAQALLQAVYQYDPTASASNLPQRTATRKDFTTGKDAQNMTALSQLALHLDHLNNQTDTVSGLPLPNFVNGAINSVTDKSNGATTAFDSSANAVAHELRAVFANAGGGTQAELEENLKQLNSSNSAAQKKAAVQNIAQLVHGRFGILQDKYSQGMGKTEDPFQTSYPGAESTILRLAGAGPIQNQTQPAQSGWSIQKVQ